MLDITNIQQICDLAKAGVSNWKDYGNVAVKTNGNLLLFNYTAEAQFDSNWNYFETVSRGLIIDQNTGEIVARPFDKFFNWMENNRQSNANVVAITEKIDGSLGILYRTPYGYKISTRGSFESEQAVWATNFLQRYDLSNLPVAYTLLFEIVYPGNRVVVDYSDREDLILLAVRNRLTGVYLPIELLRKFARQFNFSLPTIYSTLTLDDIIANLPRLSGNEEGYVVEFSDGQRFKFKGDRYKELHKLISNLSFKNTVEVVASGKVDEVKALIPDEFLTEFNTWVTEINQRVEAIVFVVNHAFAEAPKETRKDFAQFVLCKHKSLAPYLFAKFDNKSFESLIYKKEF